MNDWKSEFVNVNNYRIHVRQTGGALPAIFLLHGFTDSGRTWSRLAADLATEFNLFMPDMIGHGLSDPTDSVIPVTSFAEIVIVLMDHYGVESCGIGGHSMGGGVATVAAANYPHRFNAILLEDPVWREEKSAPSQFVINSKGGEEWRNWLIELRQLSEKEALDSLRVERPFWHPTDLAVFLHDRLRCDLAIFNRVDFALGQHRRELLTRFQSPVMLVTGSTEQGGIVDSELAQTILSLTDSGHLAHIPTAGHGIHREQYERFRDAVVPFFKQYAT